MAGIWDDVVFDFDAAQEATSALIRAADQLDRATAARVEQAAHARQDWSGAYRTEFDRALESAVREARDLVEAMRRAAGFIHRAAAAAAAEQQRRVNARAELLMPGTARST